MVYNSEIYTINPKADRIVIQNKDTSYKAYNVGNTNVTIAIIQGDIFAWHGTIISNPIVPGQGCILTIGRRAGFIGVKVINQGHIRAYVHVRGVNVGFPEWDGANPQFLKLDNDFLKTCVAVGAAYVPYVGNVLAGLVSYFWPSDTPSVWDQVKDKVFQELNKKTQESIRRVAGTRLNYIKERIKTCAREIEDPNITKTVAAHFINIAEDLIGFEKMFVFDKEFDPEYINSNYVILPMWANVINLKLKFYQFGVVNAEKIGLNDEHVFRLKDYIQRTVNEGAAKHVDKVFKEKYNDQYNNLYGEVIYDQMSTVRTYCALNGFQHLVTWKAIAENPLETKRPINPVIVYSNMYGRGCHIMHRIQVPMDIPPPLKPKLVDGDVNLPTTIDVYLNGNNFIAGIRVTYQNNDVATAGPVTSGKHETVNITNNVLKLTAHGDGQINGLEWEFEDGNKQLIGTAKGTRNVFSLEKHRIVGYYMTASVKTAADVVANVAVSYQLCPESN